MSKRWRPPGLNGDTSIRDALEVLAASRATRFPACTATAIGLVADGLGTTIDGMSVSAFMEASIQPERAVRAGHRARCGDEYMARATVSQFSAAVTLVRRVLTHALSAARPAALIHWAPVNGLDGFALAAAALGDTVESIVPKYYTTDA